MDGPHGARTEDQRLKLIDAGVDLVTPDVSVGGLGLIVRGLARALGAEMALLAVPGEASKGLDVLAAWGTETTHDGLPAPVSAGGFVDRALSFERATVEPIDPTAAGLEKPTSGARITTPWPPTQGCSTRRRTDPVSGEEMWRLTERGRQARGARTEPTTT